MQFTFHTIVWLIKCAYLIFLNSIDANDYKLTIIHANDIFSAFAGVNSDNTLCDLNSDQNLCVGGAQKIASKVREFRGKEHVLFLNVGGNLGGFWFNHFGSKVVIDFMRALQFDVIALGLSDYALNDVMSDSRSSFDNLTQFISNVSLVSRIVSCNVDVDTKYISNFYQIVRKSTKLYGGNRRIGVIGFVKKPNHTIISSLKRDYVSVFDLIKISDPIKCLQEEAENLRKEGIDIIIAIGSGDSDYFKEIASNVPNVDVVIGGYASSKNMSQLTERTSDSYPDFVVNANSGEVIISTADVLGKSIGKMSITFDKKGVVKSNEGVLIKLDNNVDSDPDTNKLIDKYERALIIGTTNVFLNGSHCGVQECNLGNLIADSLVFYRVNYINESLVQTFIKENGNEMLKNEMNEARDVIGLISGESISNSIGRIDNKEYFITKVGLDQVFSNSNSLDINTIKMYVLNGETIRHLLEDHLSMFEQNFASNKLLQVSGIKVIYDFSKPSNERLTDILVKCTLCSGENFNKLNDTKFYDVLMPQSIKMKSDINSLEVVSDLRVYDIVEHYIRENSPIATKIEDRITIRERTANNETSERVSSQLMALFIVFISLLLKH